MQRLKGGICLLVVISGLAPESRAKFLFLMSEKFSFSIFRISNVHDGDHDVDDGDDDDGDDDDGDGDDDDDDEG